MKDDMLIAFVLTQRTLKHQDVETYQLFYGQAGVR
jgi:hypothetical protein